VQVIHNKNDSILGNQGNLQEWNICNPQYNKTNKRTKGTAQDSSKWNSHIGACGEGGWEGGWKEGGGRDLRVHRSLPPGPLQGISLPNWVGIPPKLKANKKKSIFPHFVFENKMQNKPSGSKRFDSAR